MFKALIHRGFSFGLTSCQQSYPQNHWIIFKTQENQTLSRCNEDLSEKEAIKNVTEDDKLHKIMNKILREIKLINIKND